jgi:hypothetical protein
MGSQNKSASAPGLVEQSHTATFKRDGPRMREGVIILLFLGAVRC